ncbi:hypothetical protein O6H91_04G020500 [Diphasiastrum complanatum]|uniref:Uncharacterized protein n=1 Tax=Diphasiastrum complanatum TaxID=34168 RepID=A0ACC2DV38_DIPCM|nr:hypothetical protein O6H91_04G020500 [Diphasiastrum complanatum]
MASCRWWSKENVALVTGANTGIGFAIVKILAQHGLSVVLTCRSIQNGQKAVDMLREEGLDVAFHQLDVTDPESIIRLSKWVGDQFGGIDILINNAGITIRTSPLSSDSMELVHSLLRTNYYGAKSVIEAILPLFRHSPAGNRIINVSAVAGQLSILRDEACKRRLSSVDSLTEDIINSFLQNCLFKFEENLPKNVSGLDVIEANLQYPNDVVFYSVSKAALNAYTAMLARNLVENPQDQKKFFVNCMCPGLTSTRMSGNVGHSPEEGADTAVWLALLPASECPTGKFFRKRQERSTDYVEELFEEMQIFRNGSRRQKE